MTKEKVSLLRKASVLSATTVAALAASLGVPMKKAIAATLAWKAAPAPTVVQPTARLEIIQPRRVDPSTERLLKIADKALSDNALAERIFREPDVVASQYHLSNNEKLVLRQMDQEQFQTARTDASHIVAERLSKAGSMRMPPGATNARLIAERMIVGRAILAAVGRSYLEAVNAHNCCPWSGAIELGVASDPAVYNRLFNKPAGATIQQREITVPESGIRSMQPGTELSRPGMNRPQ